MNKTRKPLDSVSPALKCRRAITLKKIVTVVIETMLCQSPWINTGIYKFGMYKLGHLLGHKLFILNQGLTSFL